MIRRKILLTTVFISIIILSLTSPAFAEDASTSTTPAPYEENEFPNWAKDLRRTEIITFGSMPFVTLGVTLGFGTYQYATGATDSFPNPFNKSSSAFTTDQQFNILKISALISLGLGITDYIINLLQRLNSEQRLKKIQDSKEKVIVTPITPEEAGALLRKNTTEQASDEGQSDQNDSATESQPAQE